MTEVRREARQIWKHFERYHKTIGEAVIYFRFDAENSRYHEVYDEGYRRYLRGVRVPVLWVDQTESTEDYTSEGRRPTQRLRFAVSAREMYEAGFSVTEVHGNRLQDTSPSDIWRQDRMHDIVYYDGRYYEISAYQIRGRVQGEDVIIGITCIETFPDDDMVFDYKPGYAPALVGGLEIIVLEEVIDHLAVRTFEPVPVFLTTNDVEGHRSYWNFGDGSTGVSITPNVVEHIYIHPGEYIVSVVCHGATTTAVVTVPGPPAPTPGYGNGPYGFGPYGGTQ